MDSVKLKELLGSTPIKLELHDKDERFIIKNKKKEDLKIIEDDKESEEEDKPEEIKKQRYKKAKMKLKKPK